MPIIDHILPYCDGTNTIDDLGEILEVTRVHVSNTLRKLQAEGKVVLDYTIRPMRPYRPELRPPIYFPTDTKFKHIPLPVSVGGYNWALELLDNVTSSRVQTAMTYLRQGKAQQAADEVQPIIDEFSMEQVQTVALIFLQRLFGQSISTQFSD